MPTDRIIRVRYLTDEEIRIAADRFREEVCSDPPPIDAVFIAEVILKLDLIPIPGLFREFHRDAALSKDLEAIYVDEDTYAAFDRGIWWGEKRLRFSISHELCHFRLHANEIRACKFASIEEYKEWLGSAQKPTSPEYQGEEFAGRFLVPLDVLLKEYDHFASEAKKQNPEWLNDERAREATALRIAPLFGVNPQVIETRFDREGIWPAE